MNRFSPRASLFLMTAAMLLLAGCAKVKKKVAELSFDELKERALESLDKKKKYDAIEYLEQMVFNHADHQKISSFRLMLADMYFKASRYTEAFELYHGFREFYPSDKRAEYAFYRAILSKYYQTLRTDCDDSDTKMTLDFCKTYMNDDRYFRFQNDVNDIHRTCVKKLIDKEVYIFNWYLGQSMLQSAQKRIEGLREKYVPKDPEFEARVLYLEGKLAKRQKEHDLVKEKVTRLVELFPDSQFTRMARGLVTDDKGLFVF